MNGRVTWQVFFYGREKSSPEDHTSLNWAHINPYDPINSPLLLTPPYEVQIGHKGGINRGETPEFVAGGENFGILDFKMYLEMLVFSCKNPKLEL